MSQNETDKLIAEYKKTGSLAVRNQIVMAYMPLVVKLARVTRKRLVDRVDVDDLVATGVFGLVSALRKFDPARGYTFATFANLRIRGAMIDGLRNTDRVPRWYRYAAKLISEATDQFKVRHGRTPTRAELFELVGLSRAKFDRMMTMDTGDPVLFSEPLPYSSDGGGGSNVVGDIVADPNPADSSARLDVEVVIDWVLKHCGIHAALLLRLKYLEGLPFGKIGDMVGGMSEAGMCVRHKVLMAKLKQHFAPDQFRALAGRAA